MRWPPVIDAATLPRWMVARDVILTLAAWALLIYFVRDLLWMAFYWPFSTLGLEIAPRWKPGELWRDLLPFLKVVALFVLWLTVFALVRRRLLTNRARTAREPAALESAIHAEAFSMSVAALDHLRRTHRATIDSPERKG